MCALCKNAIFEVLIPVMLLLAVCNLRKRIVSRLFMLHIGRCWHQIYG
jgi:hypothetical protein